MRKTYLSIIIPSYNSAKTLGPLLRSIFKSSFSDFETIVVDDASTDNTSVVVKKYKKVIYHLLEENRGAGAARSEGAKLARGKFLVFTDSDVVFYKNTLGELVKSLKDEKQKVVVGGYDKVPANSNPTLFHSFKAMRDWAYWNLERDKNLPVGGFGGCIAAIKKDLFEKLGGFDESYRGAGMEDYEFGWRLVEAGEEIVFNPKVKVKHHFSSFSRTVKTFYLRTYLWTKIFFKYQRFFSSATNPKEALVAGLANLSTGLLFVCLLSLFMIKSLSFLLFISFLVVFLARLFLGRTFLFFAAKEKGVLFAIATLPISHTLYLAVYVGAARAVIEKYLC